MKKLHGYYFARGYEIADEKNHVIYSAGNHCGDSQTIVAPGDSNALTLEQLKEFCEYTGREMAKKRGDEWVGCEFIKEEL